MIGRLTLTFARLETAVRVASATVPKRIGSPSRLGRYRPEKQRKGRQQSAISGPSPMPSSIRDPKALPTWQLRAAVAFAADVDHYPKDGVCSFPVRTCCWASRQELHHHVCRSSDAVPSLDSCRQLTGQRRTWPELCQD
ncbi:hypothetical protein B0J13DRAFT_106886 [Dactylonectria estremocensis]|uniref:Uncharacterized protein n=1 Tax=Dactylonectria estremocensis TaxID=1079267 RepID=A0A9P9E6C0_9HYPO|nr:hypothetical protein B0J13DRAFT_106886 [Dactylonectria estremocensis]